MPIIHYHYNFDLNEKQKEDLVDTITKAVHESTNTPKEHVRIFLHQTLPTDHSIGGKLLSKIIEEKKQKQRS
jgi:4-oxalocrotonate tautomerase family enzyme